MTNTITSVVDTYIAAWNEGDAERRLELVAATWTDDGSYLDPLIDRRGHGTDRRDDRRRPAQFPGHHFALATGPDAHNDMMRFSSTLNGADEPVAAGTASRPSPTTSGCTRSPASSNRAEGTAGSRPPLGPS